MHPTATAKLEVSRTFSAGRERVFDAWTNSDQIERWWAPPGFRMGRAVIDLRKGGCFRISMVASDNSRVFAVGMLENVQRPELLEFLWKWEGWDPGGAGGTGVTRVTVSFREKGDATEVALRQEGFTSDEIAQRHVRGWRECLERMARLLQ